MNNVMKFGDYKAVISYDPEISSFRGEFIGLNGGADFYASDVESLQKEGEQSLKVFLDVCREKGREPLKCYSGKFNVRLPAEVHASIVEAAAAEHKSLNQWVAEALADRVRM